MSLPDARKHNPDPQRVRRLIERAGLPKPELAKRLGYNSHRIIDAWLQGTRTMPYTAQYCLERLAQRE